MFNELCPTFHRGARHAGVTITGQVDEIVFAVYSIEIDRLCTARSATGEGQSAPSNERINQAGLADIAPPEERDFRQTVGWELLGTTSASYKLR